MSRSNWILVLSVVILAAGCGGSSGGNQAPAVNYATQVSFGDSLSDVGSYKVGTVLALGGGQYTINGAGKNWTELMAAQLGLAAPCAAQTGLNGDPVQGFSVAVVNHPGCTSYAQGGARVTNPVGPGNALLGGANAILGQLTVPVATQVATHLATQTGGTFKGNEIVFLMAGANDALMQFGGAVASGVVAPASAAAAVAAMGTAASELATLVNTQVTGKGAKHVVVVNVPDITITPMAAVYPQPLKDFLNQLVTTFNTQLRSGLANNPAVLLVDAHTASHDQVVNPQPYGLTNVTQTACNITNPTLNPLGSSLVCKSTNLNPGVVDHYLFADDVHPTPYGYWLLARLVSKEMVIKGWL